MIITIIALVVTILGFVFLKIGYEYDRKYEYHYCKYEFLAPLGVINLMFGSIGLFISIFVIIMSHATAPRDIQKNKMEYEGLCKRYAIVTSEYEDVSKSDVIADITAWNIDVYNKKYWADNPWTNWFNPKEIADNLNYISLEE